MKRIKAQRVQIVPLYRYTGEWLVTREGKLYIDRHFRQAGRGKKKGAPR